MKWWPSSPCFCWPTISDRRKGAFHSLKSLKISLYETVQRDFLFFGGLLMPQILLNFTHAAHNKLTLVPVTARRKAFII